MRKFFVCNKILSKFFVRSFDEGGISYSLEADRRHTIAEHEWWSDVPLGPQGPHDGLPDALRAPSAGARTFGTVVSRGLSLALTSRAVIAKIVGSVVALAILVAGLSACVALFLYLWVMPMHPMRALGWKEALARVHVRTQLGDARGCVPPPQAQVFLDSSGAPVRYVATIRFGQCGSFQEPSIKVFGEQGTLLQRIETFPQAPARMPSEADLARWVRGLTPGESFPYYASANP